MQQSVHPKLSRGRETRTYGDPLVSKVAKQLMLSRRDLVSLVECTISGADYVKRLRAQHVAIKEPAKPATPAKKK